MGEEAQQFDWLAAMDDGKVIATGSPQELLQRTGCDTLESAFISLLPQEKRDQHKAVVVPPMTDAQAEPAIQASHLTRRFGEKEKSTRNKAYNPKMKQKKTTTRNKK